MLKPLSESSDITSVFASLPVCVAVAMLQLCMSTHAYLKDHHHPPCFCSVCALVMMTLQWQGSSPFRDTSQYGR